MTYPVTTFVYLDDTAESGNFQEPTANSTVISHQSNEQSHLTNMTQGTIIGTNQSSPRDNLPSSSPHGTAVSSSKSSQRVNLSSTSPHGIDRSNKSTTRVNLSSSSEQEHEQSSYSVGHISHIPRPSPSRTTYVIPSIINKSIGIGPDTEIETKIHEEEEDLFGMIKLKENDVCYTSGTIEWVGKKRSFPINSGFKIINDSKYDNEPLLKRHKNMNKTYTHRVDIKECDCADVLPTVNAIVDHLNALHEAVDLVDLRINTLEDVLSKDKTID